MHQVADLPHQGLVLVDKGLRLGAILVEAGRRHRLLELLDRLLGLRDFALHDVDLRLFGLRRTLFLARLGVEAFFLLARNGRRLRLRLALMWGGLLRVALLLRDLPALRRLPARCLAPEKLLVRTRIEQRSAVADLEDLRRKAFDEVAIVRHEDQRAAVVDERVEQDLLRVEIEMVRW